MGRRADVGRTGAAGCLQERRRDDGEKWRGERAEKG